MKFAVIVDSKTGNTRQCADWIVQGMKSLRVDLRGKARSEATETVWIPPDMSCHDGRNLRRTMIL